MLTYYCSSVQGAFGLPCLVFNRESNEMIMNSDYFDRFSEPFLYESGITSLYQGNRLFDTREMVSYYISDDGLGFGCVSDMQSPYSIYVGPCLLAALSEEMLDTMMSRSNSPFIGRKDKYSAILRRYLASLPRYTEERFMELLKFTNSYVNRCLVEPERFSASPLSRQKYSEKGGTEVMSDDVNTYIATDAMMSDILSLLRTGDRELLSDYWFRMMRSDPILRYDTRSALLPLRQHKNFFLRFLSYIEAHLRSYNLSAVELGEYLSRSASEIENAVSTQQVEQVYRRFLFGLMDLLDREKTRASTDDRTVREALEYIHDHIREPLSGQIIAEAIGISRGHLSSLFNSEMGISIPDYINREKIEVAKVMLESRGARLVDISNYLSFSSQSYFQKVFRKVTGMTPLQYRNQVSR